MLTLEDFFYTLPSELIAKYPMNKRSESRLLSLDGENPISHKNFHEISGFLKAGDLLVFNDTKVIPARLFGHKKTGGKVEVFVERVLDQHKILAQVRASKSPHVGDELLFEADHRLIVANKHEQFYELHCDAAFSILELIESIGQIPLPPYMHRLPEESDKERYQTIYAKHKGSVAAPTAGFHFDEELLQNLRQKKIEMAYLTLHIGAGTFSPVRVQNIKQHKMHAEYLQVSAELCEKIKETKSRGGRVVAVGTTSLRALETASQSDEILPYAGETKIFIYPGYEFRCVDALITNLHLPSSTLLMLVCAFGGYDRVMKAYQAALDQAYRFYSYGDAMWVTKIN